MSDLLEQIILIVKACGKIVLNADRSELNISDKPGAKNFVTRYDVMVQNELKKKLSDLLPSAMFLCEEDDNQQVYNSEYVFVIDPIDGTTNFIKDYKNSCISVGLVKNNERYIGVVYNPYTDEVFSAQKGNGAYLNGQKISVSSCPLENGLVLFGTSPYYEELSKKSFQLAYEYFTKAADVRRSGSAALDLCSVACGRAELYFELKLSPWDFCAGALIVEEAGGIVSAYEGGELPLFAQSSILARNN